MEPGKTNFETSGCVTPERVKKWPLFSKTAQWEEASKVQPRKYTIPRDIWNSQGSVQFQFI